MEEGELIRGKYRLIRRIGQGSFGEVWLARDEEAEVDVAIKFYIALDRRGNDEFRAEYQMTYDLNHPNLLRSMGFGVLDTRPFIVMPYCPIGAESLIGKISEDDAWRFIRDVSSGLAYLHSKSIIHRDIKPDNVLRNEAGDFLISDFGTTVRMRSTLRRASSRNNNNDTAGSLAYMAPELFSNNPQHVLATDVWALGVTLYEMLTGELPFFGQGGAILLHGAEIPEVSGDWSSALKATVRACLAKDTWERPTAEELHTCSDAFIRGSVSTFPWEDVALSPTTLSLQVGDSGALTVAGRSALSSGRGLTWHSSDASVAVVANGKVTAIAAGTAIITVDNGYGRHATCEITVQSKRMLSLKYVAISVAGILLITLIVLLAKPRTDGPDLSITSLPDTTTIVNPPPVTVQVTGVSLDRTNLTMTVGGTYTLTATVTPSNATDKSVSWSSSSTAIATVSSSGVVTAKAAGNATITVRTTDGGKTATCNVTVNAASSSDSYVDLGLSVKWATCNVGATRPEEYGSYFAWGEISTKSIYDWSTYQWCRGSGTTLTKYNSNGSYGNIDYKTVLDLSDDAARAKLGSPWRMPTQAEQEELLNNCTWTWTTMSGVKGYKVSGTKSGYTGNWIFLPAAGYYKEDSRSNAGSSGYYWSSMLESSGTTLAYYISFSSSVKSQSYSDRYYGRSVRPVHP